MRLPQSGGRYCDPVLRRMYLAAHVAFWSLKFYISGYFSVSKV